MSNIVSERWAALERARLALARFPRTDDDLARSLARLAQLARRMLGVERVSVWDLDPRHGRLLRRGVSDERGEGAEGPEEVALENAAAYAQALATSRVIPIPDVARSPWTASLLDGYCRPLGIVSMLDVPVYCVGEVMGVVCHEHRGRPREWTDVDAELAVGVADVASALRVEHAAREAELAVRTSQARLHELMRRAAVGRVARGLAHDLANVLTVVSSCADVLEQRGRDDAARAEALATLRDTVASAQRLCDELGDKAAAPEGTLPPPPIALDEALARLERPLAGLAADRAFSMTLGAGAAVRMTEAQLEQIVLNLLVNAREATSPGERIAVRSGRVEGHDGGRAVALVEVSDGGHGMDERTLGRLFEPHFSTKGPRRGIGLATVNRLVEGAGGWIEVESEPGAGATFRVFLPIEG